MRPVYASQEVTESGKGHSGSISRVCYCAQTRHFKAIVVAALVTQGADGFLGPSPLHLRGEPGGPNS